MKKFQPVWYTTKDFADSVPLCIYHKEQEKKPVNNNGIKDYHVLLRADYEAEAGKKCLLRISADDYYKLYINGVFVTQGPAPAYPEAYYYNELDVTGYLKTGKNVFAVHLYYQGLINRVWNSGDNRCGIGTEVISYDETTGYERCESVDTKKCKQLKWRYQISDAYQGDVTGYDTQFLENFDSRKWDENWNRPDYDDSAYCEMLKAGWADYHFMKQPTKQLSIYKKEPAFMEERDGGIFIDMGEEVAGVLCMKAVGKLGKKIYIYCGEECDKADRVRYELRCNCTYKEEWTLDEGENTLEQYFYKAFRYVWLVPEKNIQIKEVWTRVQHYPMEEDGCTFSCSDKKLEKIFQMCKNTVKYGTQEGYLDCLTREKGQYLGDAIVTAHAQVWLTGSTEMLRKCISQFAGTGSICKGLLAVAPGALMQEIADFSLLWSQLLLLDYQFTGDKDFLKTYYPVAKGILEHFGQYAGKNGLLYQVADKWNLVDWPENVRDNYDFTLSRPVVAEGCHNVVNALYVGAAKTLAEIEEILKLPQTIDWLSLKNTFCDTFFCAETGVFTDSEKSSHSAVHSNIYPLYFGLAPKQALEGMVDFLRKKGLCCGVFLSYFFLKALAKIKRWDVMYELLVNESEHGWVNMLKEGATTCYEVWGKEQKWNTSLLHPWASAPIPLLIEEIAGFCPVIKADGTVTYKLEPHIPQELEAFELRISFDGKAYTIAK